MSVDAPTRTPLGRWTCRYHWIDHEGRRRSGTADGTTEAAARREATELRQAARVQAKRIRAGIEAPPKPPAPTFAEYVLAHHDELWPVTQNRHHRAAQVARLARFAEPVVGSVPVDRVTRADVRRVMANVLAEGLTTATANRTLAALSVVLRHAAQAGLRVDNPCNGQQMRETGERTELLELDEVAQILALAPEHWRAFFAASFFTGARPSSLRSLRVRDVDLLHRTIYFPRWKARGAGRSVPMPEALEPYLRDHLRVRRADGQDAPVWAQADGRPISETGYRKAWLATLREAGITRPVLFADLRASFATHLAGTGVAADVVRRALGHASLATTDRYLRRSQRRGASQERAALDGIALSPACVNSGRDSRRSGEPEGD